MPKRYGHMMAFTEDGKVVADQQDPSGVHPRDDRPHRNRRPALRAEPASARAGVEAVLNAEMFRDMAGRCDADSAATSAAVGAPAGCCVAHRMGAIALSAVRRRARGIGLWGACLVAALSWQPAIAAPEDSYDDTA
ncbi:MAG TPA: hypothetical protein VMT83_07525, partial [Burkholderiaceae bacterium]|nr:hypothetical protein [Burkholderiaceae bacterium]